MHLRKKRLKIRVPRWPFVSGPRLKLDKGTQFVVVDVELLRDGEHTHPLFIEGLHLLKSRCLRRRGSGIEPIEMLCPWLGKQDRLISPKQTLQPFRQIVQQMPAICHLKRGGSADRSSLCIRSPSIATDHFHSGMSLKPLGKGFRASVSEEINRPVCGSIDEDGPVGVASAKGKIIHSKPLRTSCR